MENAVEIGVGVAAFVFLVLRCLSRPEQPWPKWLLPLGILGTAAMGHVGQFWVALAFLVTTVAAFAWDWFWRLGHDVDVFW